MIQVEIKTANAIKTLSIAPEGDVYRVPRAEIPADAELVTVSFPFLDAQAGDAGYYITNSNKSSKKEGKERGREGRTTSID